MTRMLRSISASKAAVSRADVFLRTPRRRLEPGTKLLLGASTDQPCDCFPHRRRVGPALPGDVERRAVADREKDGRAEGKRGDRLEVPRGAISRFDFDAAERRDPVNSGRYTVDNE